MFPLLLHGIYNLAYSKIGWSVCVCGGGVRGREPGGAGGA